MTKIFINGRHDIAEFVIQVRRISMTINSLNPNSRSFRQWLLLSFVIIVVASPWTLLAQTQYNTTATVYDGSTPTSSKDLTLQSDDINPPVGQLGGTYVGTTCDKGRCSNIGSVVGNDAASITLFNQSYRTVYLHFVSCAFLPGSPTQCTPDGKTPPVNDGLYSQNVEEYVRCLDGANQFMNLLTIGPGTSYNRCLFGIDFSDSKAKYKLFMGPYFPAVGSNQPTTGWVTFTCGTAASVPPVPCNSWNMVPYLGTDAGNYPNVAALYRYDRKGLTLVGYYNWNFRIDMTNP